MASWCRLCKRRAVEGSIFCEEHRARAERFAFSFGDQPQKKTESPPASEGDSGSEPTEALTPTTGVQSIDDILIAALATMTERIRSLPTDEPRWPQLSVYWLRDRVLARAYFGIIPRRARKQAVTLDLREPPWRDALSRGGCLFDGLKQAVEERLTGLRDGSILTLDLAFVPFPRLALVKERRTGHPPTCVASFEVHESDLRAAPVEEYLNRLEDLGWRILGQMVH